MQKEKWIIVNKKGDFRKLAADLGIDPLTARILINRDIADAEQAGRFLNGTLDDLPDPALLKDAEKAAELLRQALSEKKRIAVASDYDVDGLFAGQILQEALEETGFEVKVFTPNRIEEGYGLNRRIVDDALAFGAGVLLTCDNGIAAGNEIAYAKERGLTVLVTDHHEAIQGPEGMQLPTADAVIDPKRPDDAYPFEGICGAVVALKLMQLFYRALGKDEKALWEKMLAYAAMATVADVMELKEENRVIVREGLKRLQKSANIGIRALIREQGIEGRRLTPYHIGFVLGPCFNAAGRLQTVEISRSLLNTESEEEAERLAKKLSELNKERQNLTLQGLAEAEKEVEKQGCPPVLLIHLPDVHESVAGIIAGRLKEKYNRPALVLTGEGELCKGSGRSTDAYPMLDKLNEQRKLFSKLGGHAMAAGFSVPRENIEILRIALNANSGLTDSDFCPIISIDAAMPPEYVTAERIREWDRLEPFGKGFERPLFARSGLELVGIRVLGQKRNAVRLRFTGDSGQSFEGIWFGDAAVWESFLSDHYGEKAFTMLERGQLRVKIALAYQPTLHEYEGRQSIQFQIKYFQAVS